MKNFRFLRYCQDPRLILTLILLVFFLKGIFLVALQPIFGGQDEARHYNTIQFISEPKNKPLIPIETQISKNKDDLETYKFSEEIKKTATATNTNILRENNYNTIVFSNSSEGTNELEINKKQWLPINGIEHDTVGETVLYHRIASQIEMLFSNQSILVRFSLIRIFSVLLATLAVFLCYLTARTIGFSNKASLILTAILSFQPKFSLYSTNINYDSLLIPSFFLFTYAGVLTLKWGLNWKNIALLLISMFIATQTKATGYILIVIFIVFITCLLYEKIKLENRYLKYGTYGMCLFSFYYLISHIQTNFLTNNYSLEKIVTSVCEYVSKTITFNKFIFPSSTYWGTLSWVNSPLLSNVTNIIFIIETIAIIGLGILLFSKKLKEKYPTFLPAKKYIVFLMGMIIALQLGIRIADWESVTRVGGMKIGLGTPGRYFLPNLASHILLVGAGIGALLASFKKEKYFETALLTLFIGMFTLMTYLIFDVIILRFYF